MEIQDMEIYNMDDFDIQEVEDTREYKFARDLIRYVLENRMAGLQWTPEAIFKKRDPPGHPHSPFTPQVRAAVEAKLNNHEHLFHNQFDNHFTDGRIVREPYIALCRRVRVEFLSTEFSIKRFFRFSVVLAKYAGLSYLYGIVDGRQETIKIIVAAVRHLMRMLVIDDDFWDELHNWSANPDLDEEFPEVDSDATETSSESGRQPL